MTENLAGRGEGLGEAIERVKLMAMGDPQWDLSENDRKALTLLLAALEAAAAASTALPPDWPECKEFYDLMQFYRHTPIVKQALVVENYEEVKHWLRKEVAALATPSPQAPPILTFEDVKSCPALTGLSRAQADAIVALTNRRLAQPPTKSAYPRPCGLCPSQIESDADKDWHGLGNCVPPSRQGAD